MSNENSQDLDFVRRIVERGCPVRLACSAFGLEETGLRGRAARELWCLPSAVDEALAAPDLKEYQRKALASARLHQERGKSWFVKERPWRKEELIAWLDNDQQADRAFAGVRGSRALGVPEDPNVLLPIPGTDADAEITERERTVAMIEAEHPEAWARTKKFLLKELGAKLVEGVPNLPVPKDVREAHSMAMLMKFLLDPQSSEKQDKRRGRGNVSVAVMASNVTIKEQQD